MSKTTIASVAIAGFVAIGATRKPLHTRHRPPTTLAPTSRPSFAAGVRVIPLLVSVAAAEH
jgi:hypothetical protein